MRARFIALTVLAAGLAGWAEIALLLFLAAFVLILVWIFAPGRRRALEAQKHLPFTDGESTPPASASKETGHEPRA